MAAKFRIGIVATLLPCLFYCLLECGDFASASRSAEFPDLPPSLRYHLNLQRSTQHHSHHQAGIEKRATTPPTPCRGCGEGVRPGGPSASELKHLRYDILKRQFLRRLHMTGEPRLRSGLARPAVQPLLVAAEMADNATDAAAAAVAPGDATAESVVIYPSDADPTCFGLVPHPCVQLQFRMPLDAAVDSPVSTELWLHKTEPGSRFQLTELALAGGDVIEQVDVLREGLEGDGEVQQEESQWTKYRLPSDVIWSNAGSDYVLTLQVKCLEGCPANGLDIISGSGEWRPFLVMRSSSPKGPARSRRSVDCVEGKPGCCRETFYLNFSEVGWDNWILHPEGYYANFCRGRCVNDLSNTRFYHSAVLISYIQDNDDMAAEMGLNMCCTPSAMSPVSIIYMNEEGLIYHKSIENMKVEACDCA